MFNKNHLSIQSVVFYFLFVFLLFGLLTNSFIPFIIAQVVKSSNKIVNYVFKTKIVLLLNDICNNVCIIYSITTKCNLTLEIVKTLYTFKLFMLQSWKRHLNLTNLQKKIILQCC